MIQVTSEEAKIYKGCPVVLDHSTGFYVFPVCSLARGHSDDLFVLKQPTDQCIIKMAMHLPGYSRTIQGISTPWTLVDDPDRGHLIPKANLQALRRCLREVYPDLAERPFSATRLCW